MSLGESDNAVITLAHPPDGAADGEGLVGPSHPAGVGAHVLCSVRLGSRRYMMYMISGGIRYKIHCGTRYAEIHGCKRLYEVHRRNTCAAPAGVPVHLGEVELNGSVVPGPQQPVGGAALPGRN